MNLAGPAGSDTRAGLNSDDSISGSMVELTAGVDHSVESSGNLKEQSAGSHLSEALHSSLKEFSMSGAGLPFDLAVHDTEDRDSMFSFGTILEKLSGCKTVADCGVWLAWGLKNQLFSLKPETAGPSRTAGRNRPGSLFPLPVEFPSFLPAGPDDPAAAGGVAFATECWLGVACTAINTFYDCQKDGTGRKPGKVHRAAMGALRGKINRFLQGEVPLDLDFPEVVSDLKSKKISYTGEEISQPYPLTMEQIEKGLPPPQHGGSVDVMEFLTGRTKYLMENPEECLLPMTEWGPVKKQAKVHVHRGEELKVFKLLESRGVVRWVPESSAFQTPQGPLLNGLFGVVKPGKFTSSNLPVLRVIMNLIPANSILSVIKGDISTLPSPTSWIPLVVAEGSELYMSQADMSCAFYLFRIPHLWEPYMCFNYVACGADVGLDPTLRFRPACIVLPMGWSSSVGVMQMISREILLRKLPNSLELKKGKPLPPWFAQAIRESTCSTSWWQVYLDNFMSGEVIHETEATINAQLQDAASRAWGDAGVLTAADKQVINSPEVTELGIRLDGRLGMLGASPARILKTLWGSVFLLSQRRWDKKLAQMILGLWVFILQFRRAAMGVLSQAWDTIETPWPHAGLVRRLHREVLVLMCLAPLLQTDMQIGYDPLVTCSDASETGGASAMSSLLTWSGRSLVGYLNNLRARPIPIPVLVISVFNGIGGSFRIYDVLGLELAGKISIDISRAGNRTTRSTWPDVIELHDIEKVTKDDVRSWANTFSRISEVHVIAGFPCVHLSSARAYRQNLAGEGSRLFWTLLTLLGWVHQVFGTFCKVKHCVENVASMDEAARREISKELDIVPVKLDPADCMDYSRPRLAWCSVELFAMDGVQLWTEKEYIRAVVVAPKPPVESWIRPGWTWPFKDEGVCFPTFMKSIKRNKPPPAPAGLHRASPDTVERWRQDCFRFPPYQYAEHFMLCNSVGEKRPLDSSERELLLGFGPGHTLNCLAASEAKKSSEAFEDLRKSLCGDSFSILSFAIMISQMCAELVPRMGPGQIVQRLGLAPGASAHPAVLAPLTRWLQYGNDLAPAPDAPLQLVQHLGLMVNHTGTDVRIQTGHLMGGKSPAHGSVRAWWWQWK